MIHDSSGNILESITSYINDLLVWEPHDSETPQNICHFRNGIFFMVLTKVGSESLSEKNTSSISTSTRFQAVLKRFPCTSHSDTEGVIPVEH